MPFCQTSDKILLMIQVLNRIGLDCPDLETLSIKDQTLTTESQFLFSFLILCMKLFFQVNKRCLDLLPYH